MGKYFLCLGIQLVFICCSILTAGAAFAGTEARVLSFADWRGQQINQAANFYVKANNQLMLSKRRHDPVQLILRYEADKENCRQTAEIAQDFTIEDYLSQYIARFPSPNLAISRVASKLSRDEVHKLILAVLKSKNANNISTAESNAPSHGATSVAGKTP